MADTIITDHQATGSTAAAVRIRGVDKNYGSVPALRDIDLTIHKGEFFSLLGPSGCGKSTTLALIGGFEQPTRGSLAIDGKEVANVPSFRRPVNTVFQSYALFPHMTVGDNVGFGLRMKKVAREERRRAVLAILSLVSLDGLEDRWPAQLSGGQRQRVALARALVNRPSVLLLDEPLGALDLKLRKQMQAELTSLQRKVGITFVYVTHDQEEALTMSNRIAVMNGGKVLQVGTPAEIYDEPAHRFVMEFMGSPNILPGRIGGGAGETAIVELDGIGPMPARRGGVHSAGDRVALLVRPERLRVSRQKPEGAAFQARAERVVKVGFVAHCHLVCADGRELLAYRMNDDAAAGDSSWAVGDTVFVSWGEKDATAFGEKPGD